MAASYDDIKKAKEELLRLRDEFEKLTGKRLFNVPTEDLEVANTQITQFSRMVRETKRESAGLSSTFGDLNQQLKANLAEIDKSNTSLGVGKKAYRELTKQVRELADEEAGIGRLSFKQLKTSKLKADSAIEELRTAAKRLAVEKGITKQTDLSLRDLTEHEKALLSAFQNNFQAEEKAARAAGYRLDLERNVLDTVKLTGGALQGIGNLASSLGLQGFAESLEEIKGGLDDELRKKIRDAATEKFLASGTAEAADYQQALDEVTTQQQVIADLENKRIKQGGDLTGVQEMELKAAKSILSNAEDRVAVGDENIQKLYENVEASGTLLAKFKALGKAAKEIGKQLSDPLFIIGSMVKGFMAIDAAATSFQRTTGQNVRQVAALNSSLVTSKENIEMMSQFAEQTGMNINDIFNSYDLARITEAGKLMGVGADGAAKLAQNIALSGVPLNDFQDAALAGGKEIVAAGGAGINLGKVLQDASTTSEAIALSLGNNPHELARAAAEAQRLGMNLDQIDGIANSMLDFESSIQNELEAQLLTGKQINLAKAREAALNNDMAGLAREISENNALSDTFSSSNRIQQEAMAKALGMSRNDLAKMVALDMLRKGISADTVASQMKMSKEQLLQMEVQEKFNTAIGKLQQSLAPIVDVFAGILDIISPIVQGIGETFAHFANIFTTIKKVVSEFFGFNDEIQKGNDGFSAMGKTLKIIGNIVGGVLIARFFRLFKLVTKLGKSFKTMSRTISSIPRILATLRKGLRNLTGQGLKKTVETTAKSKGGQQIAAKGAGAMMKKIGGQGAMKLGGKALGKLLPGVGLAFALSDFMEGDITGGIINTLAGIASFFPGIGTAISGILTAVDLGRELYNMSSEPTEMAKGGVVTKATNIIAGEAGAEAIIPLDKLPSMLSPQGSMEGLNAKFDEMIGKLDELTNIRGDVYIDGYNAGQAIFAASNNLPS